MTAVRIDLHCHSHYSDGLHPPELLIQKALAQGLTYLALTDHDTLAGVEELSSDMHPDLTIIPGIELSVRWKSHDIHLIGLQVDIQHSGLLDLIQLQNINRIARGRAIGQALSSLGIAHAYEKACALAGHERVGRAHYAQLLLNQGLVPTMKAAFSRYLGRGKVAYVPSCWISMVEALPVIKSAGGQGVIAHPLKYKLTRSKLLALIEDFISAGGEGLEVVSGDIGDPKEQHARYWYQKDAC